MKIKTIKTTEQTEEYPYLGIDEEGDVALITEHGLTWLYSGVQRIWGEARLKEADFKRLPIGTQVILTQE